VETAYARADGGRQTLRLFSDKLLPSAEDNIAAATAAYKAGKLDFLRLVEAQRQLIELKESQQGVLAQYHRDLAELERATGGALPLVESEEQIPVPPAKLSL
jgi:outer membrane protein TolC